MRPSGKSTSANDLECWTSLNLHKTWVYVCDWLLFRLRKDRLRIWIVQTLAPGIRLVLGLRMRMWEPCVDVVVWGPISDLVAILTTWAAFRPCEGGKRLPQGSRPCISQGPNSFYGGCIITSSPFTKLRTEFYGGSRDQRVSLFSWECPKIRGP